MIYIIYATNTGEVHLFHPEIRQGFGTAGVIYGKTTGYKVIVDEANPWMSYYEIELYNHIWGQMASL